MSDVFDQLLAGLNDRPDDTEKLFRELKNLPRIEHCVRALVLYALSFSKNAKLHREGSRYVLSPTNFVAFTSRHKRTCHVTIELRGNTNEFEILDKLSIKDARAGSYSKFDFHTPSQLAAAAMYVRRAHQLYRKGAGRTRTVSKTSEIAVESLEV